ncbi:MAG: TlpA family protein disulfide reductase [Verrucomicrobia bacterium]|nr:TlpA family protein disulfide reductase [Verrucomicrobiota bacterium]
MMNKSPKGYALVGVLLVVLAGCEPPGREKSPRPGTLPSGPAASVFSIPSLQPLGEQINLESFKGKVVLLDFWATWCPPCRSELPALGRLYEDLKDQGFVLVGMTVDDESVEQVARAAGRFSLPYPVGLAGPEIQEAYGGIRAVPTKFLLDRQGSVRQRYLGVVPDTQIRADVSALLAESKAASTPAPQ